MSDGAIGAFLRHAPKERLEGLRYADGSPEPVGLS